MPRRPQRGPARPGSGPGSRPGRAPRPAPDRRIWVEELGFGPKATFSALFAAEMRFFKTHGFVKPLLREMLFRRCYFCLYYIRVKEKEPLEDQENLGHVVPIISTCTKCRCPLCGISDTFPEMKPARGATSVAIPHRTLSLQTRIERGIVRD